jgi:upstream activation factor subunit UAF30
MKSFSEGECAEFIGEVKRAKSENASSHRETRSTESRNISFATCKCHDSGRKRGELISTQCRSLEENLGKMAKKTKKKATAKKATAKKATAKKATAKKATAKKATAKKTTAKKTARKPNAAFMRPLTPSESLAVVVGNSPLPRTEVTKKIWAYIRKNNLQDSKNRRMINADVALKSIFGGKTQVSMFEMTKLVNKHLS